MSSLGRPQEVLQQADQLWSMLDELSQSDPAAYQRFLEKHMKQGLELSAPPQPHSCLSTDILLHFVMVFDILSKNQKPKAGRLYINICSWKRVPAPQDPSKPVPVCGGKLEAVDAGEAGDSYTVLDVAFSPGVLQEAWGSGGEVEVEAELEQLHLLALSFARQQHGFLLSPRFHTTAGGLKGRPEDMRRRLGFFGNPPAGSPCDEPHAAAPSASLLQQISSLRMDLQEEEERSSQQLLWGSAVEEEGQKKRKNLIQVVSSSSTAPPQTPEYHLKVDADADGGSRCVELSVELPRVGSMSECHLSISQDDVLLEVEDLYHLLVALPERVMEESASATFDRKRRRLTLRANLL